MGEGNTELAGLALAVVHVVPGALTALLGWVPVIGQGLVLGMAGTAVLQQTAKNFTLKLNKVGFGLLGGGLLTQGLTFLGTALSMSWAQFGTLPVVLSGFGGGLLLVDLLMKRGYLPKFLQ